MTIVKNPGISEENPYYYDILYGAFLHDIGKFYWRADKTQPKKYLDLTEEDIGHSGAHAKWSANFFDTYLKGKLYENVHYDIIENLILYHHNPLSRKIKLESLSEESFVKLVKIVQIADHASSGERIKREKEEDYGSTRTEVMHTIFSSVKLQKSFNKIGYYSIAPLITPEKSIKPESLRTIFPKKSKKAAYGDYASDTQPLYKTLFNSFINELTAIIENNGRITFGTLYNLSLKYLINIPSATYVDIPDISLFDHIKSTAAIAICLFQDLMVKANSSLKNLQVADLFDAEKQRYLLLMGNISGIQNFIYSIASKGAAKGLKGRSFFVEYLGKLISQKILEEFNLPNCCEIYCDGGNFYSLIPACFEKQLQHLSIEIKEKLLSLFKGELFIDIGWIPCNYYNFSIESPSVNHFPFNELWTKINAKVGKLKFQRFNEILAQSNGYNKIFGPESITGIEERICSICKLEKPIEELKNEEIKCALCKNFEEITQKLVKIKYLVDLRLASKFNGSFKIKSINDIGAVFDHNLKLLENDEELKQFFIQCRNNLSLFDKINLYNVNSTLLSDLSQFLEPLDHKAIEINIGFEFVSNVIPLMNDAIKDFDNIAIDERTIGDSKLGLLRMDIDNLGMIFSKGLKINSLSRLSSLSLRLKLFFKYWINEICKGNILEEDLANIEYFNDIKKIRTQDKEFLDNFKKSIKENIYLIYSSGDDLFVIGHWNDIISLALIIREVFSQYTLQNPNLTISAGAIIITPKFPLYQAAELAGNAEETAKSNEGKDSVSFLGRVYSWKEFKELSKLKEKLYNYYKFQDMKKTFLHKLLQFNKLYEEEYYTALQSLKSVDKALVYNKNKINLYYKVDKEPVEITAHEAAYYSKWYWRFIYYLKRTIQRNKNLQTQLEEFEIEIVNNKRIKDIFLPARWVELLTKSRSKK